MLTLWGVAQIRMPGVQAILQQWQEVKTEHGTVERTYTQCAQTWPLANHVKVRGHGISNSYTETGM